MVLPGCRQSRATMTVLVAVLSLLRVGMSQGEEEEPCGSLLEATIESAQGEVDVRRNMREGWQPVSLGAQICAGDSVRVGAHSRAMLFLRDAHTVMPLDQQSAVSFPARALPASSVRESVVELLRGTAQFLSRTPMALKVRTPFVNAHIKGTEFLVEVVQDRTTVSVFEGTVLAENAKGALTLAGGESASARRDVAPARGLGIAPTPNSVHWALHYPPLLDAGSAMTPALRQVLAHYRRGHLSFAFNRLESMADGQRDAAFRRVRAGLLLIVGRADEADRDIAQLLRENPRDGVALALSAVVAVAQNRKADALESAQQAVAAAPDSPTAHIALAYARQANFAIPEALASVETALRLAPDLASAWALRAELELSLAQSRAAKTSAEQAVRLDPNLPRTQTVLGFAALQRIAVSDARRAFLRAIELDSADPQPRFGLGLALIRQGDLAEGTRQLEIATMLAPNDALLRSYLGKAYYEQKRSAPSEQEYALAKRLDPSDPTAYFYDALKKQAENRPVEALHDLQKAMDLNDNRAVYRSRELLDADRAVRGASLARVYDTLGFAQRGVVEASQSLTLDPANYSAHRFLSDTYGRQPDRQISQLSELLQAQLLQPINVNPLQPSLSISSRQALGRGIAQPLFRDFTRLFERNKPQLSVAGVAGNQGTLGDEVVLSGIQDRLSYSIGQYHYRSSGFRDNADRTHDIYNVFLQAAVSENFNLQFEALHRETLQGYLIQDYTTPPSHDWSYLNRDVIRGGVHVQLTPNSHVIASVQDLPYRENGRTVGSEDVKSTRINAGLREGQYLWWGQRVNLILGIGSYEIDTTELTLGNQMPDSVSNSTSYNTYFYSNWQLPGQVTGTIGLAYDWLNKEKENKTERVFPKFGLQWNPLAGVRFRGAYAQGRKPELVVSRTIQPTQIAGFNQFFDDLNDRNFHLYGAALDLVWRNELFSGVEFYRRDIFRAEGTNDVFDRQADSYKAYVYWAPVSALALTAEYRFERDTKVGKPPSLLETYRLPLGIRYFHGTGIFAELQTSWIRQYKEESYQYNANFVLADLALGYRLPARLGIVSLEIRNLFDKQFKYDDRFGFTQSDKFYVPLDIVPDRSIFGRVLFNF